jgi:GntR family transcriptional regulator
MPLNPQSPIPLYRQLAGQILADIENGLYPVASRIPSENTFASTYSIGRPTVRQATDWLIRQGRLERRRGSGTYVLPPVRSIDLFSLAGTSAALQNSELDAMLEVTAGPELESSGDDRRLRIERVARVEGRPVMHEVLRFDAQLFAGLDQHVVSGRSLSALVRDVFFLEPSAARQTFFAVAASKAQAKHLKLTPGTPVLLVQRALHFDAYEDALLIDICCHTDHFEFSQTLYPALASGPVESTKEATQ